MEQNVGNKIIRFITSRGNYKGRQRLQRVWPCRTRLPMVT